MKLLFLALLLLLAGLQYQAWYGDHGYFVVQALSDRLEEQKLRAEQLRQRNRLLAAEVLALKQGHAVVEARARVDLGMIRADETFYIVTERTDDDWASFELNP